MANKEEKVSAEKVIRDIRRETRRKYNAEEKIRILLEMLRPDLCKHGASCLKPCT